MKNQHCISTLITLALVLAIPIPSYIWAQYPQVPRAAQQAEDARRAAYEAPEDAAWLAAQDELQAWAKRGKPYIPWAAKPADLPQAKIPAFPGAWGGGMYSFGGRGGKVYLVTSLADSGPGTLREACNAIGPRTVVFQVAGMIHLQNRIRIRAPYITIAGQTAPGDGICVRGATVCIDTHDVVIRHMRFRRGETDVANRDDSLGGNPIGNIILDHVSASWGLDENFSLYRHMYRPPGELQEQKLPTVNITIQWCLSSEALDTYNHSLGSTIGGHNCTFHHNLWACNAGRNPSIGMDGGFNFVNNVIFNWRHRTVDGGDQNSLYNIIANYYKPGPATPDTAIRRRVLRPDGRRASRDKTAPLEWGRAFVSDNIVEGEHEASADNWRGGVQIEGAADPVAIAQQIRAMEPFPMAPLPSRQTAQAAYQSVLELVGATLPNRDAVDLRIIDQVRQGSALAMTKQGIITAIEQVGGYPQYTGVAIADADQDGLPDSWEQAHGLNPQHASDALRASASDGYTNFECFLNGLDPSRKVEWTNLTANIDSLSVR